MSDERYMQRALRLAKRGTGRVSPNPRVGAVVVKNGRIIGEGFHKIFGGPHAEVNALSNCSENSSGATLYVTLEPCCHHGKTPPCTQKIIQSGIKRVVVGCLDPNPQVSRKGIKSLQEAGIHVEVGIEELECKKLIEMFSKYITQKIPFVTLKIAQTLDGKIATVTGDSKWITSEKSRKVVHQIRKEHDAILVGVKTVITDNPQLNIRMGQKGQIKRIVLDSQLKIPLQCQILNHEDRENTIVVTTEKANPEKLQKLKKNNATIWYNKISKGDGRVDIQDLLIKLGKQGITSLLVEGGGQVFTSFLKAKFVDRVLIFTAPKIVGNGKECIGDLGITNMDNVINFKNSNWRMIGDDILFEGDPCLQE